MGGRRRSTSGPADPLALVWEGNALRKQYEATGDLELLDRSVAVLVQARAAVDPDSEVLLPVLSDLGLSLRVRAAVRGVPGDLAAAVEAHEEAYRRVPADSQHRAGMAGNLAGTLRQRWEITADRADLDRAVALYREAVALAPPDSSYAPTALSNLANGLAGWYESSGDRAALDEGVRVAVAAVDATAPGSSALPRRLANASGVLRVRGKQTGDSADLRRARDMAAEAWRRTPPGSPEHADRCATLGAALGDWFVASGELAAVDQGVEVVTAGLRWARGTQARALLVNLAALHRLRYEIYDQPADLERALWAVEALLDRYVTAPGPLRAHQLVAAATLRQLVGDSTGDRDLLAAAGDALHEAAAIPGLSPVTVAAITAQRGSLLHHRRRIGDESASLDEAVRLCEAALAAVPAAGGDRARMQYQLAHVLSDRAIAASGNAEPAGAEADLARAEELLDGLRDLDLDGTDAGLATEVAQARGVLAAHRGRDADAAAAFVEALDLSRRRFAQEVIRRHREGVLGAAQGLSARAAVALAWAGRAADAVLTLEVGLAVLASDALARDALDTARVAAVDPALAERLRAVVARLREAERTDRSDAATPTDVRGPGLAEARAAFDATLAEIRAYPGLADVLAAPTLAGVVAAAADRPLVYLAATDRRGGVALLVQPPAPTEPDPGAEARVVAVPLPGLTLAELYPRLYAHLQADRATGPAVGGRVGEFLDWLGGAAVRPWLDRIDAGSVRIVPVGLLALCPLHAATVPARSGGSAGPLLDRLTVSFAPNARIAALAQRRAATRAGRRLLAVADPQPVQADPLPLAGAEVELVAAGYPEPTVLRGAQATTERVVAGLAAADVVHLACHGAAAPSRPQDSGLLLAGDERLTVADLIRADVPARLVVLSACETAMSGTALPDEAVALPTGFVQAGAAGVVGSLWRVPDAAAAVLMVRLHELLRAGDEPAAALGSAQRWLRDVTNGELLRRWPALAVEPLASGAAARRFWAAGRPFADPRCWAAFLHVGA